MAGVDTPLLAGVIDGVMLMALADENADRGRPMQANERRWRAVARELAVREAMLALSAGLFVGSCKRAKGKHKKQDEHKRDDGRTDHMFMCGFGWIADRIIVIVSISIFLDFRQYMYM